MSSTDHLANAREYIAKGDEFYAKAADEIIAAQSEDPTLSNYEVARRVGRNESWVRKLVQSRTSAPRAADEPFTVDWQSGDRDQSGANRVARERPEEFVDAIRKAPVEAQREIMRELAADSEIVHSFTEAVGAHVPEAEDEVDMVAVQSRVEDAVKSSLHVQAKRLIATARHMGVLMDDGHDFKHVDAAEMARLHDEFAEVGEAVARADKLLRSQRKIRSLA